MTAFKKINTYLRLSLLLLLPFIIGCQDDFRYFDSSEIGEGIAVVSAEVAFENFGEVNLASRASGEAIKSINSLHVLVYNLEEELVKSDVINDYTVSNDNNNRPEEGNDDPVSAETNTPVAKFKMTLNYGRYHIYVVANASDAEWWGNPENYDTVDKLLKLRVDWKKPTIDSNGMTSADNVARNAQMFGYFGDKVNDYGIDYAKAFRSPEPVVVNKPSLTLRAWIRRLASKMTIAFDTRQLKDNVYIYIKSVSLKDIPVSCPLGEYNTPLNYTDSLFHGYDPDTYPTSSVNTETESLYFANAAGSDLDPKADYTKWRCITAGDSIFGYYSDKNGVPANMSFENRLKREHSENAPALYFYENMQGEGKDKKQDCINDNEIAYPNPEFDKPGTGWKDEKKCGTYMEVEAYYISEDSVRPGRGPIKYRFMMGKDVVKDYNAERNHHYKLTLQFRGYANDIDWHIDYKEENKPGFLIPDTVYVSYLYNQPHAFAGRATPRPGYKLKKVEAVILKNEWRPHVTEIAGMVNDGNLTENDKVSNTAVVKDIYNAESWNMQINKSDNFKDYANIPTYDTDVSDTDHKKNAPNCAFGFLSLRKATNIIVDIEDGHTVTAQNTQRLRAYYFNKGLDKYKNGTNGSLGQRTFDEIPDAATGIEGVTKGNSADGTYQVHLDINKSNGEKNYVIMFPLYTRANTIGTWSVYSGANPYYTYERKAYVRYIAIYENENDPSDTRSDTAYTTVMQSQRLDNPRGIYRKYNSRSPFNVVLHGTLPNAQGDVEFAPITSHGAWSVTIQTDPYGLVRLTKGTQIVTGEGGKITGKTGTEVSFTYTPNRIVTEDMAIGAVLEVKYHNNSCIHKIIVRQGYGPVQFDRSGVTWSSFNMYDGNTLCKSPLSIGSLFRRATNFDYPIAEFNNSKWGKGKIPDENLYIIDKNGDVQEHGVKYSRKAWGDIGNLIAQGSAASTTAFTSFTAVVHGAEHTYRVPDGDEVLSYEGSNINPNINYAFGLVYGDGATSTSNTSDAYSFSDYTNSGADSKKGARGVIAYCLKHGDNVFFPFGEHGHGRRKGRENSDRDNAQDGKGVMRYGSLDWRLTGTQDDRKFDMYRPLAYNLPDQYGAAYWFGEPKGSGLSLDFNAGNYMVHYLNVGDLYTWDNKPDALPIKPIRIK